jgi:hypothetical protein
LVEFDLKLHPKQHSTYFPKELVKTLGLKLKAVPNSKIAIIYSDGTRLQDVLISIDILRADLKHRLDTESQTQQKQENEAQNQ